MRVLDIFSGIGGFSLGLASAGMRTVGFCEIEPFPRLVLAKHWPGVPIHDDVRTLSAKLVPWLRAEAEQGIDLICGGFPCQDISVAGKGAGLHGHRSGLWSEYARLVGELRPRWVIAENVGALRTRGVDRVCSDLEAEGYTVWPLLVGAWAVGAPHKRERVWIVATKRLAYSYQQGRGVEWGGGVQHGERAAQRHDADGRGERPVGEPAGAGLEGQRADAGDKSDRGGSARMWTRDTGAPRWPARPGEPQWDWEEPRLVAHPVCSTPRRGDQGGWARKSPPTRTSSRGNEEQGSPELPLGGATHGLPERLVRRANRESLKALGNAVVPQVVEAIGYAILEAEMTQ